MTFAKSAPCERIAEQIVNVTVLRVVVAEVQVPEIQEQTLHVFKLTPAHRGGDCGHFGTTDPGAEC